MQSACAFKRICLSPPLRAVPKIILAALGLIIFFQADGYAADLTDFRLALTAEQNLYAPEVFTYQGEKFLMSGGVSTFEDLYGTPPYALRPDKIYISKMNESGGWTKPEAIRWHRRNVLKDGYSIYGEIPGYQINDPSVFVYRNRRIHLFYTAFPFSPGVEVPYTKHEIGMAISRDGGETWRDYGFIHSPESGAWAPTVRYDPISREYWMYYHTGDTPTKTMRQRIHRSGRRTLGDPEEVHLPKVLLNPDFHILDASSPRPQYVLIGNVQSLSTVVRYVSDDGIHFEKDDHDQDPLLDFRGLVAADGEVGDLFLLTPHVDVLTDAGSTGETRYDVYFGFDNTLETPGNQENPVPVPLHSESIHAWTFLNQAEEAGTPD
ncbi:hypothetical protein MK280_19625 [Myxococcota bacterium]|nr:hypothetical protein [Myxococcota bacterium]